MIARHVHVDFAPVFGHRAPQSLSNVVGVFNCQVREWQAMCNRSEDRAYGVDLGLQERTLDTKPFPWSSVVSVMWYLICPETNSKSTRIVSLQVWWTSSVWSSISLTVMALVSWTCWVSSVHVAYWDRRDSWIEDRRSNTVPVTADSPGDAKNVFQ